MSNVKRKAMKYLRDNKIGFIRTDSWDEGGKYASWKIKEIKKLVNIAINEAKKEVFDEIEKAMRIAGGMDTFYESDGYESLKQRHLKENDHG